MKKQYLYSIFDDQKGVSAVIIAVCLVMLLGFMALAIDIGHLAVARNELQNAADAGALAGAAELYTNNGQSVNTNANQVGYNAATVNLSEQSPVEVNWSGGNIGDVQRGHWSFGLGSLPRGFTPNDSTDSVALWGVTTIELDENPNFINAVRVRARRQNIPIASFFARIFGHDSFEGVAEAVAYIGFAGTLDKLTANAPIAICLQAIEKCTVNLAGEKECKYECSEGRFINDAASQSDEETGLWTNLEQNIVDGEDMCSNGTNASEVKPLVECPAIMSDVGVNSQPLMYGKNLIVNNGQIQSAFNSFYNCWKNNFEDGYMHLTLPVVDCSDDPNTCALLVGAVEIAIVHATQHPNHQDLPVPKTKAYDWVDADEIARSLGPWEGPPSDCSSKLDPDKCAWQDFVDTYQLKGTKINLERGDYSAEYHAKSVYFLPHCEPHIPNGVTGGENYGILARIPVLVE
jgi:hypothetical protein